MDHKILSSLENETYTLTWTKKLENGFLRKII